MEPGRYDPDLMAKLVYLALTLAVLAAASAPALAAGDPADQAPFGGEVQPVLVAPADPAEAPPGFELSADEAVALAAATDEVREEQDQEAAGLRPTPATRGEDRWEIRYRDADGRLRALVIVDDRSGEVVEAWRGNQVETKLARGYEDAVSGDVNEWWIWLPLCVLFIAPFVDPRRPLRLVHLDLLALLGFSASLFFFNKGEIGVSVPLVYPPLLYLLARMLIAGFRPRESREPLLPFARVPWLVVAIAVLVVFRVGWEVSDEAKVIDVGVAGVIGADRLASGEDVYGEDFSEGLPASTDVRGDVYGPVNYLAYVPAEQALPWEDSWDDVPAARATALVFDLLAALLLWLLGRRLRPGEEGRTLGVALSFAWLAYPFSMYALGSGFNDSIVAALVVGALLAVSSAPGRGAMTALAGLTKFGPLALAPLLAPGTGDRRPRTLALYAAALLAVAALVTVPLLPDGGFSELYDRSLGYQADRGSPFSVWGQAPSLDWLQAVAQAAAIVFAASLFFFPRQRSEVQIAALAAAVLIAVQLTATHWFFPYAAWFAPLVLAASFAALRGPGAAAPRA